jgi:stalled ribosome rescue protein Dom34
MHIQHAVVWLDHGEAKIFLLTRDGYELATVTTELPHHQIHNKAGTIEGKRTAPDQSYFREIVAALEPAMEWLIVGPSSARDQLAGFIRAQEPRLATRIIGIESADHPTDAEIVAHARAFFKAADRMLGGQGVRLR